MFAAGWTLCQTYLTHISLLGKYLLRSSEVEVDCPKACRELMSLRIASLASWKLRGSSQTCTDPSKQTCFVFLGDSFSLCSVKMSMRQRATNSPSMLLNPNENDTLMQVLGRGCVVSGRRREKWNDKNLEIRNAKHSCVPLPGAFHTILCSKLKK